MVLFVAKVVSVVVPEWVDEKEIIALVMSYIEKKFWALAIVLIGRHT